MILFAFACGLFCLGDNYPDKLSLAPKAKNSALNTLQIFVITQ